MKNLKFYEINLQKEESPKEFLDYCLNNKLYLERVELPYVSRLKLLYKGEKPYNGLIAIVAIIDKKPVGICILEKHLENEKYLIEEARINPLDKRKRKEPFKKKYSFNFTYIGFMSFFVKEEFRNNGLAKEMLRRIEPLIARNVNIENGFTDNSFALVTAREKTAKLIGNSSFLSIINCEPKDLNFDGCISSSTYDFAFKNEKTRKIPIGDIKFERKSLKI